MDVQLLLTLLAGHYLADFGLQTKHMVEKKGLVFIDPMGFHALTAHAFIHALLAGLLSGSFAAAVVVGVTHWLIDFGKASVWLQAQLKLKHPPYGIHLDQLLHISVIALVVLLVV